ncbi:response regulator [Tunturiibacter lichenicola]|jgi:DNA-binding NarL/FixJ family response regulator|uniref:response regulator n=1 Tax=Tunturiibacter lichenicola TaxID=2051959 RepID=UPI003D9AD409
MRQIRILTIDDHSLLRAGISAVIQDEKDMLVVGEGGSGREAIEIFRSLLPDVTLMDLQMPDMNGLEAIASIRREHPQARIIVLTTYGGDVLARRALKGGATGYILKSMIRRDLLEAIRTVYAGKRYIPSQVAAELADHYAEDELSDREVEVLREVAGGLSNKIIASHLSITEATVKAHMKSIMLKLGASDRTHAVGIATARGYLV